MTAAAPTPDRSAGRWCAKCQQHGSHHTDKHDEFTPDPDAVERAWSEFRDGPDYQPTDRYDVRSAFEAGFTAARSPRPATEPAVSEAAVEAAARALYDEEANESMGFNEWPDYDHADNAGRGIFEEHARAALDATIPHLAVQSEAEVREVLAEYEAFGHGEFNVHADSEGQHCSTCNLVQTLRALLPDDEGGR